MAMPHASLAWDAGFYRSLTALTRSALSNAIKFQAWRNRIVPQQSLTRLLHSKALQALSVDRHFGVLS